MRCYEMLRDATTNLHGAQIIEHRSHRAEEYDNRHYLFKWGVNGVKGGVMGVVKETEICQGSCEWSVGVNGCWVVKGGSWMSRGGLGTVLRGRLRTWSYMSG